MVDGVVNPLGVSLAVGTLKGADVLNGLVEGREGSHGRETRKILAPSFFFRVLPLPFVSVSREPMPGARTFVIARRVSQDIRPSLHAALTCLMVRRSSASSVSDRVRSL